MAQGPATHQQEGSQFLSVSGYGVDHGDDVEVRVSLLWTDLYSTDRAKEIKRSLNFSFRTSMTV